MPDPCSTCRIRKGCDILSEMCQLTPREVVKHRPELIIRLTPQQRWRRKNAMAAKMADREYYGRNKSKKIASAIRWQKEHPEARADHQRQYGQRRRHSTEG